LILGHWERLVGFCERRATPHIPGCTEAYLTSYQSKNQRNFPSEDEAFQLGVDAYIYGYPLLVMDSIRRVSTNVAEPTERRAPMGQFAHWRSFPDGAVRLAGANLDTLYSLAWLDLSRGPYVLHLPDVARRVYIFPNKKRWSQNVGNKRTRTTRDKSAD
jgi:hypothetical protein